MLTPNENMVKLLTAIGDTQSNWHTHPYVKLPNRFPTPKNETIELATVLSRPGIDWQ